MREIGRRELSNRKIKTREKEIKSEIQVARCSGCTSRGAKRWEELTQHTLIKQPLQKQTSNDPPTYFEVYRILQIAHVHPAIALFDLLEGWRARGV